MSQDHRFVTAVAFAAMVDVVVVEIMVVVVAVEVVVVHKAQDEDKKDEWTKTRGEKCHGTAPAATKAAAAMVVSVAVAVAVVFTCITKPVEAVLIAKEEDKDGVHTRTHKVSSFGQLGCCAVVVMSFGCFDIQ